MRAPATDNNVPVQPESAATSSNRTHQHQHHQALDGSSEPPVQFPPQNLHAFPVPVHPVQTHHQVPPGYGHSQQFYTANVVPTHNLPAQVISAVSVAPPLTGWTTGLFDCCDDPMNALVTFCIPCVTFGQIAEIVDNGNTSCATSGFMYAAILCLIGCPCILSCTYRTKLRSKFNLIESAGPDWVSHFLCEACALCQEYRELNNRGLDPSIGWHANAAKNQALQVQLAMVPPTNQTMRG